eukprot:CAMPEP_0173392234 /NCGR_PEP_ID=MMETSP1356-20130122/18839_1 /TAXON_ID=77927 ORGANISM="Hemiselmis virescens, Strain PCC157" /NCGR_SAMPLE_ID=MMETSP1356 /ASSEMBLY_ACC=CAM_ASM_000847 /LENGTH=46 /DNA_ID= /DNA_START= /DNA_END= /DNA_ORIENTATION=
MALPTDSGVAPSAPARTAAVRRAALATAMAAALALACIVAVSLTSG